MFLFGKKKKEKRAYRIGLALSGGGARGFAHVGVLRAFEEYGIKPDIIAGTSAGSIVGALYADGYSPIQIMDIFKELNLRELVEMTVPKSGFLKYDKLLQLLETKFHARNIEDLQIPTLIVATDFDHGKSVTFNRGELAIRVAASCTIPIIFSPLVIDGIHYVDGGVLRNLPATPLRNLCDTVIGVNVSPLQREGYSQNLLSITDRAYNYLACGNVFADRALCDILIEHDDISEYNVFDLKAQQQIEALGYESARKTLSSLPYDKRKLLNI